MEQVDGLNTRVHVWDTTGSVRFSKITHAYYRIAHGIIVAYDSSDPEALANVAGWLEQVRSYASDSVAVVLCGTKVDLLSTEGKRSICSQANAIASKAGVPHVQTSSKDGTGALAVFETITREAHIRRAQRVGPDSTHAKSALATHKPCLPANACCLPWPWLCVGAASPAMAEHQHHQGMSMAKAS